MAMRMSGASLYVGGCLLFGVAVWQSGTINKWAGVILALHGLFIAFGFGIPAMLTLNWVLLIAGGIMFIIGVKNDKENV